jgi:hypothetical protein
MITFEVDDLDGYWREIEARALPDRFMVKLKPRPTMPGAARSTSSIPVVSAGMCASRNSDVAYGFAMHSGAFARPQSKS